MSVSIPVPLTRDKVTWVDAEDADMILAYSWYAHPARNTWYACRGRRSSDPVGGKLIRVHQMVMAAMGYDGMVDHIDGDGLNNRRANLRPCNGSQNGANSRQRPNKSGLRGVYYECAPSGTCRWVARAKSMYVGSFDTADEAALAYDRRARELFGEFATLNFPDPVEMAAG